MKVFNGIPRKRIIIDISFSCIWAFMNAKFSTFLANMVLEIINENKILEAAIFFLIYIFIWEFVEFVADIYSTMTSAIIEANINKYYFNELYKVKPSILKESNTGYISGVLHKLVMRQERSYRQFVLSLPICIIYILYFTFEMWKYHWSLGFSLISISIISNLFRLLISKKSQNYAENLTDAEGIRNKLIIDIVSNINTVQKMRSSKFMNDCIDKENDNCLKLTKKWAIFEELAFCGCKLLVFMYNPLALFLFFKFSNEINNSELFLSTLALVSVQLVHHSKSFVGAISDYSKFKGNLIKIESIIDSKNKRKNLFKDDFKSLKVKDLSYSYKYNKNGELSEKTVTINIPSFEFKKGDKVCIYGESGQGKTTLLHLISGEIENDKTFVNEEYNKERLECVFIAQDTEMFDMSLRDNLALGKDIKDEKLIEYINKVGMGDWFNSQKEGLETLLGERGVFVSTGQRQRLNLIRGLLRDDKEVYLLDEPTSNVDETTEENMINLIKEILKDKTVIIVTHRPKIKAICNKIYKFENGTIHFEE